ncbi:MAG: hypothetical protein CK424_00150 [Legionella sp.]|nr:MAG: hypothetical protein CK424_00150 [Legionella sp.]
MQKYLLIPLLSTSLKLFACTNCACPYVLDVVIKNQTPIDCQLVQNDISEGKIHSQFYPLKVAAGETSAPYTFEIDATTQRTKVTLSFQCGNKFVSFDAQRTFVRGYLSNTEIARGAITSVAGLDASYTTVPSHCDEPVAANTMYWTFK